MTAGDLLFRSSKRSSKMRRDVIRGCLRRREFRLALTILFLPEGWEMTKTETKRIRSRVSP